jgi:hypothetical protein
MRKKQTQINKLMGALNKHQSKTENTINREINELKMKILKKKWPMIWKSLEKRIKQKHKTEWKTSQAD